MPPSKKRYNCWNSDCDSPKKKKQKKIMKNRKRLSDFDEHESTKSEDSSDENHEDSNSKMKWDMFCWKCHKESGREIKCSSCVLTFHKGCIADYNRGKVGWKCPNCVSIQNQEKRNLNDNDRDNLLSLAMERITTNHGVFKLSVEYTESPLLIKPMTYEMICEKAKNCEYNCIAEFSLDFEWLLHNCTILHKNCEKSEKNVLNNNRIRAKQLLEICKKEIEDIKLCGDCYMNREKPAGFTRVCSKPHLLLWVKFKQHPYWPAKLIKVGEDSKPLEVYFFEDHTTASVSCSSCYLYMKNDPNPFLIAQNKEKINTAIEEAEDYIRNLRKLYGEFHFAAEYTIPTRDKMEEYLDEMIPGFRDPAKRDQCHEPSNQLIYEKRDGSINTPKQVKNEHQISFRLPDQILDRMRACREYMHALKAENKRLIEENELFKERFMKSNLKVLELSRKNQKQNLENAQKLIHAKSNSWCMECLNQIDTNKRLCHKCN